MRTRSSLASWLLVMLTASPAAAVDLLLPITVEPEPSSFSILAGRGVTRSIRLGDQLVGTTTPFTADPSAFDRIIWEIQAPAGKRYEVTPSLSTTTSLWLFYEFGDPQALGSPGVDQEPPVELEFIGLIGTAPTGSVTDWDFFGDGRGIGMTWSASVAEPFSFEAVRLIANGPFSSTQAWNYDDRADPPSFQVSITRRGGVSGLAPEPLLTLVPEPGSLALLGLGGLACLARRRRA